MYRPTTTNQWWFCGQLFVQAILSLAVATYILIEWQSWVTPLITQVTVSYTVPIGLGIVIFAVLFTFFLSLDAIHHQNNALLIAICICNTCTLVFSIMRYSSIRGITNGLYLSRYRKPILVDTSRNLWPRIQPAEIILSVIVGVSSLSLWLCAYFLHKEFSWTIYKSVHGSLQTRKRYRAYEIYIVLIKLIFFFLTGFILQYNLIDVHFDEPEYSLTMALIPAAFIMIMLGIYFVKHEKTYPMIPILLCYLGLIAYLISRIVLLCGHTRRANTAGKDMMLLFAFAALVSTLSTFCCAVVCVLNFNNGLKGVDKWRKQVARESSLFHSGGYRPAGYDLPSHSQSLPRLSLE
ncbi:unnamed protein product [Penicillium camemberti]|uniref:Str. FM013 n=1 Tax=Penicillium camemberti (strain FM 013) TaxID=1429867 RepID=A0A0G4PDV4_PENC3|nr:unnamed protein product [Penicillium camemberti]